MAKPPASNPFFPSSKSSIAYSIGLLLLALTLPKIPIRPGSLEFYYTLQILILGLALAPALAVGVGRGRSLIHGLAASIVSYILVILLSSIVGGLGRGLPLTAGSLLPFTASILYGLSIGIPVAVLARAYPDRSISFSLAGLASLAIPLTRLLEGGWAFQGLVGVALASYLMGVSAALVADKWGRPAGALYYALLFALVSSGPLGIGGSLLAAGVAVGVGSLLGFAVMLFSEEGLPEGGGLLTGVPRVGSRRTWAGVAALAVIVVVGVFSYSQGFVFWRPYAIVTGSMEPSVNRGDVVFVRRVDGVSVGDIITYRKGSMIVTHRVYQVLPEGVRTKGDANSEPDPYIVPYRDIIGRVALRVPLIGWLIIGVNWDPTVRLLVLAGSIIGLALAVLWPRRPRSQH